MFKFNLRGRKYREGTEGGEGSANGAGEGGEGNADGQNNDDANLISHDTLWQAETSNADASQGQQQQQQQQQEPPDPNAAFQTHIDSLDFSGGIDIAAGMAAITNGDQEAFGAMLAQVGAAAYRNAMVDANKVVQQRVDKMGEQVQSTVTANQSSGELVREMNSQLPFTKTQAYAPIAKLVLTQFLEKGATPANAIEQVGKYFQKMAGEVALLNPGAPKGRPAGGFGGNANQNDGNESGETDWMQVLGGPAVV
jgi:hypothetical protein